MKFIRRPSMVRHPFPPPKTRRDRWLSEKSTPRSCPLHICILFLALNQLFESYSLIQILPLFKDIETESMFFLRNTMGQ
ncbi:hypothetical protein ASPSYDRAFT_1057837 [Aspergillus sydowii CBS 593.65]|uniref:Uncharacterized protein n=1 Tax=Aspergillus sydowii CBS 593.65 TaxID=1036612 RepID=A0A1L9TDK4_9EURO|nr:uncharacterized protein ASPSYDRAFT_1057837 [Aspergillus sydowii CBS 593.65]OJJ57510.1 hypothetical protein ASPSYDRAFT_1057837 [Aspergillus sydowii CBS 593.65]